MFALPDHSIVALDGRDAIAFAHAQFMSDVAGLQAGQWQWSGWLTPKGRVIALFAVLKIDEETVWLLLQDADASGFASQLQRFVFRSKLKIAVRDDLRATGTFDAPAQAAGTRMSANEDGSIELDSSAAAGARTLRIVGDSDVDQDAGAIARWIAFDLAHGLPRLPASQCEQWTPQQLSLDRLHAYSIRKGCYPGQEIVARTHFLGQSKRGLALFEGDASFVAGAQVMDGERVLGPVVRVAAAGPRYLALAVLPLGPPVAGPRIDGNAVRPLALLDGLAR